MALANNENGQILLSGAFLFAMAIAITAIMLNNMIYTNNVAYTGFSEQSIYDDSSLKQIMIDEINYEYYTSSGIQPWFTSNISKFINITNNMTLTKGVYIKNESIFFDNSGSFDTNVQQKIYIYGKNFNKSYSISTINRISVPSTINGDRNPGNVIIKLGINNTTSQNAVLIIDVSNSTTYMPEPGVIIILHCGISDLSSYIRNPQYTDSNGRYYWPIKDLPLFAGSNVVNVSIANSYLPLSNNLTIVKQT